MTIYGTSYLGFWGWSAVRGSDHWIDAATRLACSLVIATGLLVVIIDLVRSRSGVYRPVYGLFIRSGIRPGARFYVTIVVPILLALAGYVFAQRIVNDVSLLSSYPLHGPVIDGLRDYYGMTRQSLAFMVGTGIYLIDIAAIGIAALSAAIRIRRRQAHSPPLAPHGA